MHTPSQIPARIISTSARLFLKEGFSVGIDRIIAETDIAKMSLYKFFPSKEALIAAVLQSVHDDLMGHLIAATENPVSDQQAVEDVFLAYCTALQTSATKGRLISHAMSEFPWAKHPTHKLAVELRGETMMFLEQVVGAAYQDRNAEAMAQSIQLTVEGYCILAGLVDQEAALDAAIATFRAMFRAVDSREPAVRNTASRSSKDEDGGSATLERV